MTANGKKPKEKQYYCCGYNITAAVKARRILLHETYPMAELFESLFTPVKNTILNLNESPPQILYLLDSEAYSTPGIAGQRINVDLITPDNHIWHLGTVCDQKHAISQKEADIEETDKIISQHNRNANNPYLKKIIQRGKQRRRQILARNPYAILFNWHQCLIPSTDDTLSCDNMVKAIRNFFENRGAPELSNTLLKFLRKDHEKLASNLTDKINKIAAQTAAPLPKKEQTNIIFRDIRDGSA